MQRKVLLMPLILFVIILLETSYLVYDHNRDHEYLHTFHRVRVNKIVEKDDVLVIYTKDNKEFRVDKYNKELLERLQLIEGGYYLIEVYNTGTIKTHPTILDGIKIKGLHSTD